MATKTLKRHTVVAPEGALVMTRTFRAPRSLVWKAWTEPESFMGWWGPRGFTTPFCSINLRVGGVNLSCMRDPDGKDYWSRGVYREIVPPERLVYLDSFSDEMGHVLPATAYGMGGDFPLEMPVTVTLEESGGITTQTVRHEGIPAGQMREMCATGWNESFDKLAELVEGAEGKRAILKALS